MLSRQKKLFNQSDCFKKQKRAVVNIRETILEPLKYLDKEKKKTAKCFSSKFSVPLSKSNFLSTI